MNCWSVNIIYFKISIENSKQPEFESYSFID